MKSKPNPAAQALGKLGGKEASYGERTTRILRRLDRANERDTGMYLSFQDVADLAYYLSTQIAALEDEA